MSPEPVITAQNLTAPMPSITTPRAPVDSAAPPESLIQRADCWIDNHPWLGVGIAVGVYFLMRGKK